MSRWLRVAEDIKNNDDEDKAFRLWINYKSGYLLGHPENYHNDDILKQLMDMSLMHAQWLFEKNEIPINSKYYFEILSSYPKDKALEFAVNILLYKDVYGDLQDKLVDFVCSDFKKANELYSKAHQGYGAWHIGRHITKDNRLKIENAIHQLNFSESDNLKKDLDYYFKVGELPEKDSIIWDLVLNKALDEKGRLQKRNIDKIIFECDRLGHDLRVYIDSSAAGEDNPYERYLVLELDGEVIRSEDYMPGYPSSIDYKFTEEDINRINQGKEVVEW